MATAGYISEIFCSFQGEGTEVGKRHLFVRAAGCHLRCRYCDTPDSLERTPTMMIRRRDSQALPVPNPLTVDQLRAAMADLIETEGPVDGIALTGGEPLVQSEFLAELLTNSVIPRPRLLETSGTHSERLKHLLPLIDIVSMDIKLPSNSGERELWQEHQRFLQLAGPKVYVKVLVDAATDPEEVERAAALVQTEAPDAVVYIQPISGRNGQMDINQGQLDLFFDLARRRVTNVRVLPQVHKLLRVP